MYRKAIIESRKLLEYSLGLLLAAENEDLHRLVAESYEAKKEIHSLEADFQYTAEVPIRTALRKEILDKLAGLGLEEIFDLENPPLIHSHSDYQKWNEMVGALPPQDDFGLYQMTVIREVPDYFLSIAWLSGEVGEEGHDEEDFQESFLILEGSCECVIEGRVIRLVAGDYLDIPANTYHLMRCTSQELGYVKALLQRKMQVG
jgi:mannose-6-phosphate isomerase-like protein (cupin superfamily)